MFWVISTAFVLQGVIMAARGPTKKASNDACSIFGWLPNNHTNLEVVSVDNSFVA